MAGADRAVAPPGRRLTAKRIRRLLLPLAGPVAVRTVRRYVAALRAAATPRRPSCTAAWLAGTTMEVDFGESWADIAGVPCKVKYLVATLPHSNVYFAKAYPLERLESLLDGIESAFVYFGGVVGACRPGQHVAGGQAGAGRPGPGGDRGVRGLPGRVSVPGRVLCAGEGLGERFRGDGRQVCPQPVFRPRPEVESWAALNALIITELDGRPSVASPRRRALGAGSVDARAPASAGDACSSSATCRVVARVADKFGHVRVDHVTYSVPIRHAYRPVWVKLYHDRVAVAVGAEVVAQHTRAFCRGSKVLEALHVLELLERKHRAVPESPAFSTVRLAPDVAAGASRLGKAHAHARSVMAPDVAADGDASGRGRRACGHRRARAPFAAPRDGAAYPSAAAGRPAAGVPAGHGGASGPGADHGGCPASGGV